MTSVTQTGNSLSIHLPIFPAEFTPSVLVTDLLQESDNTQLLDDSDCTGQKSDTGGLSLCNKVMSGNDERINRTNADEKTTGNKPQGFGSLRRTALNYCFTEVTSSRELAAVELT